MGLKGWLHNAFSSTQNEFPKDNEELEDIKEYQKKYDKLLQKVFKEKGKEFENEVRKFENVVKSFNYNQVVKITHKDSEGNIYESESTSSEELKKARDIAFNNIIQAKSFSQNKTSKLLAIINNFYALANLFYDLKEFGIRLKHYDELHSKRKQDSLVGLLSLKQIWIDTVDINKGNLSIKTRNSQILI